MATRTTARDYRILKYISETGFATIDLIRREFWQGKNNRHYYRRLQILARSGLIQPLRGDMGIRLGYRITKKGANLLHARQCGEPHQTVKAPKYKSTFEHDLSATRVRDIITKSPIVSDFIGEAEVRSAFAKKYGRQEKRDDRYKVPDALFKLNTQKGSFIAALEVECAAKSAERYGKIFRQLCISKDFDVIFFIAKDATLLALLRSHLKKARDTDKLVMLWPRQHGFYFGLLDDVTRLGLDAPFSGEERTFTLCELAAETSRTSQAN